MFNFRCIAPFLSCSAILPVSPVRVFDTTAADGLLGISFHRYEPGSFCGIISA